MYESYFAKKNDKLHDRPRERNSVEDTRVPTGPDEQK